MLNRLNGLNGAINQAFLSLTWAWPTAKRHNNFYSLWRDKIGHNGRWVDQLYELSCIENSSKFSTFLKMYSYAILLTFSPHSIYRFSVNRNYYMTSSYKLALVNAELLISTRIVSCLCLCNFIIPECDMLMIYIRTKSSRVNKSPWSSVTPLIFRWIKLRYVCMFFQCWLVHLIQNAYMTKVGVWNLN